MFQGSIPALITPMRDGAVDEAAYRSLIDWLITEGSDAVIPCGTTGESATLTEEEHERVVQACVEVTAGRVPVLAGAGSSSTAVCIRHARHAKAAGADGVMVVTPPYNKPSQEGAYQHFKAVHDAVDLPIIIYNIPARSVVDISVETMARLSDLPRIIGVKDATGDLTRPLKTRMASGPEFCQLSGEDATALPFNMAGGVGCISVTANVAPRLVSDMQRAWREGRVAEAQELQYRLMPLHESMFSDANPGPAKYALSLLGKCSAEMRQPMWPIPDAAKARVRAALDSLGLIMDRAAE